MAKAAIIGALGKIPASPHSHKTGWVLVRKDQLTALGHEVEVVHSVKGKDLSLYDKIYIYHGLKDGDGLNFIGGVTPENFDHLSVMAKHDFQECAALDRPLPDLAPLLKKRKDLLNLIHQDEQYQWFGGLAKNVNHINRQEPHHRLAGDVLIIGDSHAGSVYTGGAMVERVDFKTLHGALKEHLIREKLVEHVRWHGPPRRLVVYFGNIDIRHHVCRLGISASHREVIQRELLVGLHRQLKEIRADLPKLEFTMVAPLPIENESRKLPKTGYHEGKPFWGSWEEREFVRQDWTSEMEEIFGHLVYHHPISLLNEKGELSFDAMERPQSVHLSPTSYVWDFNNREINKNLRWEDESEPHKLL